MENGAQNLLGLRIDALTIDDIVALISQAVQQNKRRIIANHNLHSLYICERDPKMRDFYEQADHIHIDGMAIIALGRLMGIPLRREHRSTYIDLLPHVLAAAEHHQWKVFYLGSKPAVAQRAAAKLQEKYPGLLIRMSHGYFDAQKASSDNRSILQAIHSYGAQILLVGMGMPRQENWLADNWEALPCNVALCCGAALDYFTGEISTPPRWMGQLGIEWLYRLGSEPKRLWRRYLIEPWFVLIMTIKYYLRTTLRTTSK